MLPLLVACTVYAAPTLEKVSLTIAADTVIDRQSPDANAGREPVLKVGDGKVLLMKFPELGTRHGAGKRVKSAVLTMTIAGSSAPTLVSVNKLLKPWEEGGVFNQAFDGSVPVTPVGEATWNSAMKGVTNWAKPGARGDGDFELLPEIKASSATGRVVFSGLERAVQSFVDSPWANHGLRIEFKGDVSLLSADAFSGGPILEVEFADPPERTGADLVLESVEIANPDAAKTEPVFWRVEVANRGTVDVGSMTVFVSTNGSKPNEIKIDGAFAAGKTQTVQLTAPPSSVGVVPSHKRISFWAKSDKADDSPADNGLTIYPGALKVCVKGLDLRTAQATVTDFNEWIFPFSKFGTAPNGCTERIRIVQDPVRADIVVNTDGADLRRDLLSSLTGIGARLVSPFLGDAPVVNGMASPRFEDDGNHIGLLPDTRDDVLIPQILPIPDGQQTGDVPLLARRLLSRTETNVLNRLRGTVGAARSLPWSTTPPSVIFRIQTVSGLVPEGTRLDVYRLAGGAFGSSPVYSSPVAQDGVVLMPPRGGNFATDGSDAWLLAVVSSGSGRSASWVPVWRLWDEETRGNKAAAFIEVAFRPVVQAVQSGENVAVGRLVSDANDRFPAQLSAIVDGDHTSSAQLAQEGSDYWVEVDLGRERQINQIVLEFDGKPWKQFRIITYKTAQTMIDARVWATEANGLQSTLKYESRAERVRFVRIVPTSGESVKLSEIKVVAGN